MTTLPLSAGLDETLEQESPRERQSLCQMIFGPRVNLAILLVLFVLVLGQACFLVALASAMAATDPRSVEIYKLVGFCGIGLAAIVLLIRQERQGQYLHQTSHELRNAVGGATNQMQMAAVEAKCAAEKAAQKVEHTDTLNREELRNLLQTVANEAAERGAQRAIERLTGGKGQA
jgi:hypothetical protein